jgi:hypothetical protein
MTQIVRAFILDCDLCQHNIATNCITLKALKYLHFFPT